MAEDDIILVKEEAREIMRDLEKSVPTLTPSGTVTGAELSAGAVLYRDAMSTFIRDSTSQFKFVMKAIRTECDNAVSAIDDLHRQDQEIMALLKKFDEEIVVTPPQVTTAADDAPGRKF